MIPNVRTKLCHWFWLLPFCFALGACQRKAAESPTYYVGHVREYTALPVENRTQLSLELMGSMKARRDAAWTITKNVFSPVTVDAYSEGKKSTTVVPTWQTWYSITDLVKMARRFHELRRAEIQRQHNTLKPQPAVAKRDKLGDLAPYTPIDYTAMATTVLGEYKEHRFSLVQRLLEENLAKSEFHADTIRREKRSREIAGSQGFMLFSPSLVRHYFVNYDRVRDCEPEFFQTLLTRADVPPASLPADAQNRYALCFENEFPADAVMIKTLWYKHSEGQIIKYKVDPASMRTMWKNGDGRFVDDGWATVTPDNEPYTIEKPNGEKWSLAALHIGTKDIPEWMWVSLFWSDKPQEDFGADRPPWVAKEFPELGRYKLCANSHWQERDPNPGKDYRAENNVAMAEALETMAELAKENQWCANPYLENGFAKSSCIGCHAAAAHPEPRNFPITMLPLREIGFADFLQSFSTFRYVIVGTGKVSSGARFGEEFQTGALPDTFPTVEPGLPQTTLRHKDVEPILLTHCIPCHRERNNQGLVRLDDPHWVHYVRRAALACIQEKCPKSDLKKMPPVHARWSPEEKDKLLEWLKAGAPY